MAWLAGAAHRAHALRPWARPLGNGLVVGLTGYASTVALIIGALVVAGAGAQEVVTALFALGLCMGLPAVGLSWRYRRPLSVGWSTAGAALLLAHGPVQGGLHVVAGAFLVAGMLTVLTGLWGRLARAVAAVPCGVANAVLAGLLTGLWAAPLRTALEAPWLVMPILAAWCVARSVARAWAIPVALLAALAAACLSGWAPPLAAPWHMPALTPVWPVLDVRAEAFLALPLFVVTMLSQNAPAFGVLREHGLAADPASVLKGTGAACMAGALFAAPPVCLASVTAAMCAGSDSGQAPERRWAAAAAAGLCQLVLGVGAVVVAPYVLSLPQAVVGVVACLVLLVPLAAALRRLAAERVAPAAAAVAFLLTCAGSLPWHAGGPLWGVLAGLLCHHCERHLMRARPERPR